MCKLIPSIGAFFIVLTTSGCSALGLFTALPAECENETPTTLARISYIEWQKKFSPDTHPTKADFLKAWGKPDMITATSDNSEIWIYKRHLWCGGFFIIVPIGLPVCDGFERVEFQGDNAKRMHIRRTVIHGLMFGGNYTGSLNEPDCWYPLPANNEADSEVEKSHAHASP